VGDQPGLGPSWQASKPFDDQPDSTRCRHPGSDIRAVRAGPRNVAQRRSRSLPRPARLCTDHDLPASKPLLAVPVDRGLRAPSSLPCTHGNRRLARTPAGFMMTQT